MPLIKSGSREAISQNISEMVKSGHSRAQAIAAALSTARRYGKATGGEVADDGDVPENHPLLDLVLGTHADDFLVTPEREAIAHAIRHALDVASPREIAEGIHRTAMNSRQLDNAFSFIPEAKKRAVLEHLDALHGYSPEPPPAKKHGGPVLDRALKEAKKFASGGPLDESGLGQVENHVPHLSGMLNSSIPGRTDKLSISVKAGSYVVPSDTISALGEGNTMAGTKMMDHMIASHVAKSSPHLGAIGLPGGKRPLKLRARRLFSEGGMETRDVPIIAAGGEYVVSPEAVAAIGGGSLEEGHNELDRFVKSIRKRNIKTLRSLRPPKTD